MSLFRLLLPAEPRSFRGRRGLKIFFRAAHVLCAGVVTGAYVFETGAAARSAWLSAAIVSGLAILLLDLYESGVFLVQLRGFVVAAKIALLAALPLFGAGAVWVLAGLVVVSSLISHAPGRVRYYLLLGGRGLKGAETKG